MNQAILIGAVLLLGFGAVLAARRKKEAAAGKVRIGGKDYPVMPLTVNRLDRLESWLEAGTDPSVPYSSPRVLRSAQRVLRTACPGLAMRTLKNAPAREIEKAFFTVMEIWGFKRG